MFSIRALLVTVCLLPALAPAVDYGWCVDDSGSTTLFDCSEFVGCSNSTPFASIQEALTAAAVTPDADSHHICVISSPPHSESFVVDASDGTLTDNVRVEFRMTDATSWCPGSGGGPAVTLQGDPAGSTELTLLTAWSDFSTCGDREGPLLSVTDGSVTVDRARLANLDGDLAALDGGAVLLLSSRFERFGGAIATGSGTVQVDDSEVSGFNSQGQPLLAAATPFGVSDSALFGNVVSGGSPLLELTGGSTVRGTTVAANVVLDDAPLLRLAPGGTGGLASVFAGELSRNVLLGTGSATVGPLLAPDDPLLPSDEFCLPSGSQGADYASRPPLASSGATTTAPLIEVAAPAGSLGAIAALRRMFVVENQHGATPVVGVTGPGLAPQVTLLHNTFSQFTGPLVAGSAGGDERLVAARNLYASAPTLDLGTDWTIEATMDVAPTWSPAWPAPALTGAPGFLPEVQVETLTSCERVLAVCPNLTSCDSIAAGGPNQECANDRARAWIPTEAAAEALRTVWPWETATLPRSGPATTAGATGWTCEEPAPPFDIESPAGVAGDADGWSTLTDCDNDDEATVPVAPEDDGFDGRPCEELSDDCYLCPEGTATTGDDDDSTSVTGQPFVRVGACAGCGVPLGGGSVAFLALLPLLGLRRRR